MSKPLKAQSARALQDYADRYVARYAATRARLARLLTDRVRRGGWDEATPPDQVIADLLDRLERLGALNDAVFAVSRAGALNRRGQSSTRIRLRLRQLGADAETVSTALESLGDRAEADLAAAHAYAKRRRLGPYGRCVPEDTQTRQRAFATMVRAGHSPSVVARLLATTLEDLIEGETDAREA
jgi:regulatory protein